MKGSEPGMTGDDNPLASSWRFLGQDLGLFSSERVGARSRVGARDDCTIAPRDDTE